MRSATGFICLLLAIGCASGPRPAATADAVQTHVYAQPLEEVLPEAAALLVERGWKVQRSGDQLGTGWRVAGSGSVSGWRVDGERIDADHCRIRIEGIDAVSLGSAIENRQSRQGTLSGDVTAGSDRIEAGGTLVTPPSGLVALPRGRDDALEWALLQRLDPRAAQALERPRAGPPVDRASAALPGSPLISTRSASTTPPDCGPAISGAEPLVAARRLVLLADVPGTREIPRFIASLTCRAAESGVRTVVGLELLRLDQELVDTYLAGQGRGEDRAAFVQLARSFGAHPSTGRGSEAVLALLDGLREMRDAGLPVRVFLFDEPAGGPERDRARARTVERLRRSDPDALMLVAVRTSDVRTQLRPGETAGQAPLGWTLDRWGLRPVALDVRFPGGAAWACASLGNAACGPALVPPRPARPGTNDPSVEVFAQPGPDGIQGEYRVGLLTASPPPKP